MVKTKRSSARKSVCLQGENIPVVQEEWLCLALSHRRCFSWTLIKGTLWCSGQRPQQFAYHEDSGGFYAVVSWVTWSWRHADMLDFGSSSIQRLLFVEALWWCASQVSSFSEHNWPTAPAAALQVQHRWGPASHRLLLVTQQGSCCGPVLERCGTLLIGDFPPWLAIGLAELS